MIGIITPYKINNYGTKLQAYAMQELMRKYDQAELLGFISSTDHRCTAMIEKLYLKVSRKITAKPDAQMTAQMKERAMAIAEFDKQYAFGKRVKGNRALSKELKKYSTVVCGSDQLWAPSNVIADYFTMTIIPNSIRKVSYAASFGVNQVPKALEKKYKKFLSRLDAISVREERGRELVQELAEKEAEIVLDPTLMLERSEWEKLSDKSKIQIDETYIFCYFLGTNPKHREFAKELAQRTGKKLVTFPHFKMQNVADENFGDVPIYNAGPIEFLNLIRNADHVCTDSFHGTVFSLIFGRSVAVFERFDKAAYNSTNSRIYTLLNSAGVPEHIYTNAEDVERYLSDEMNYTIINKNLDKLRKHSFAFLDTALQRKRSSND